jgi:hypothetical protein
VTVGFASAIVNGWLDGTFATATCFVKLHIGDPGAAGATSPAAGSTTRVQATMAAASAGSKAMTSMASTWTNGGTTETLTHISLWTAATVGTFNASGALGSSQPWASTNTFALTGLTIAITPIAA